MKANELMIGDYVIVKTPTEEWTTKVAEIYTNRIIAEDGGVYVYDEIFPVPLTPEILEKSGFGYTERDEEMDLTHYYLGERYFCKNMNLHIGTNNKGVYWLNHLHHGNDINNIRYAHELQHALHICKIDKTIEL